MKYSPLLLSVILAGCSVEVSTGGGKPGKGATYRDQLHAGIERLAREHATPARDVRCPPHVQSVKGGSFECEVMLDAGTFVVVVETHDDEGNGRVYFEEALIGGTRLESQLEAMFVEEGAKGVHCGSAILRAVPDASVECAVDLGRPGKIVASVNADGGLHGSFRPAPE